MPDFTVILVYEYHDKPQVDVTTFVTDDRQGAVLAAIDAMGGLRECEVRHALVLEGEVEPAEYSRERIDHLVTIRARHAAPAPATTRVLACSCDAPVTLTREADGCSRGVCAKCGAVLTILHRTPTA